MKKINIHQIEPIFLHHFKLIYLYKAIIYMMEERIQKMM